MVGRSALDVWAGSCGSCGQASYAGTRPGNAATRVLRHPLRRSLLPHTALCQPICPSNQVRVRAWCWPLEPLVRWLCAHCAAPIGAACFHAPRPPHDAPDAGPMARIQAVLLLAAALAITAEPAPTAAPFTLPKLPYNIKRFETAIDEFTMNIHWNRCAAPLVAVVCRAGGRMCGHRWRCAVPAHTGARPECLSTTALTATPTAGTPTRLFTTSSPRCCPPAPSCAARPCMSWSPLWAPPESAAPSRSCAQRASVRACTQGAAPCCARSARPWWAAGVMPHCAVGRGRWRRVVPLKLAEGAMPPAWLPTAAHRCCPRHPPQVRNNAGGLWNHGLFFLHNLAPFNSQVPAPCPAASRVCWPPASSCSVSPPHPHFLPDPPAKRRASTRTPRPSSRPPCSGRLAGAGQEGSLLRACAASRRRPRGGPSVTHPAPDP